MPSFCSPALAQAHPTLAQETADFYHQTEGTYGTSLGCLVSGEPLWETTLHVCCHNLLLEKLSVVYEALLKGDPEAGPQFPPDCILSTFDLC